MRFVTFEFQQRQRVGVRKESEVIDLSIAAPELPGSLKGIIAAGSDALARIKAVLDTAPASARFRAADVTLLPPIPDPGKIICVGLNYIDHAKESPYKDLPTRPVIFGRYANSLVASGAAMVKPASSDEFDWEGELVAVIGKSGRNISKDDALDYVVGYSVFNDGSVRDYQFHSHQWIMGKTFDGTGGFGPDLVTADEVPPGATGLRLVTRINGSVMQDASTTDMIFDIRTLVAYLSEAMTLSPGDIIVAGTPAGVGFARKPAIFLKAGDVCEVEIESIGVLRNPIVAEK
jgi:2-keto-4-pentenoate hydratase/2-oxohepta-3-ene-1,7-dioic acid hydratase in catechol pathway